MNYINNFMVMNKINKKANLKMMSIIKLIKKNNNKIKKIIKNNQMKIYKTRQNNKNQNNQKY